MPNVAVTGFSPVRHRVGGVKVQTIYGHNLSLITSATVGAVPLPLERAAPTGRSLVVRVPSSAGIQVTSSQPLMLYYNPPWDSVGWVYVFHPEDIGPVTFDTIQARPAPMAPSIRRPGARLGMRRRRRFTAWRA